MVYLGNIYQQKGLIKVAFRRGLLSKEEFCERAIDSGDFGALRWGLRRGFPLNRRPNSTLGLARAGRLDLLRRFFPDGSQCGESTWREASRENHVDVMKWLYTSKPFLFREKGSQLWDTALSLGRIDILGWMIETNRVRLLDAWIGHPNREVVKRLVQKLIRLRPGIYNERLSTLASEMADLV